MKKLLVTAMASLFLLIAGCNSDDKSLKDIEGSADEINSPESEDIGAEETKSAPDFPPAPTEAKDIIASGAGEKMKELQGAAEGKLTTEDFAEMDDFPAENMTVDEIFNGIVEWYAMDYSVVHDPLFNFEPDYGEYGIDKKETKQLNISVLIDASGSMKAYVGGEQMMALAKDAVKRFGAGLPEESIVSLRVYGHEGTGSTADKEMSCASNELFYSPDFYEESSFNEALTQFDAAGWTPLAAAIKAGGEDLRVKASSDTQNMIFVVSDGVETCGGNPVEEAKKVANSDLNAEVNVLGFNLDSEGQKQLKKVAEEGNGKYANVKSRVDFQKTFQSMLAEANAVVRELNQKAVHGININNHTTRLYEQINKLHSSLGEFASEEGSILSMAVKRLRDEDRIDNETQFALSDLIDERRDTIRTYGESLRREKLDLVENTRQEIFKALNEE
ncbi:vWA domain-containing protein [Saccharococcus sp. Marseille-Q5394]|uniref:vWA domain-containing protein n=1 Tax=Saccharococcus sp. Marseille-Q5394 TaxID=2972778 RepID=UPI0021C9245B|nr:VWA domain-containing protein [Saccharococcus sp. Marseille-Q5394]